MLRDVEETSPRDISLLMWNFASHHIQDRDMSSDGSVFEALAKRTLEKAIDFSAKEIATTLSALARMEICRNKTLLCTEVVEALVRRAEVEAPGFSAQQAEEVLVALAKLEEQQQHSNDGSWGKPAGSWSKPTFLQALLENPDKQAS